MDTRVVAEPFEYELAAAKLLLVSSWAAHSVITTQYNPRQASHEIDDQLLRALKLPANQISWNRLKNALPAKIKPGQMPGHYEGRMREAVEILGGTWHAINFEKDY